MRKTLQIFIITLFWGWIVLLGIQSIWPFLPPGRTLAGAVVQPQPVKFSLATIRDGTWARSIEKQYDLSFHVRPFLVRLDNELNLLVFRECPVRANASSVVLGTNDVLFDLMYIRSAIRPTYSSNEQVKQRIDRMVQVQHLLEKRGIAFCLIIAPSKAEFIPESVPARYWVRETPGTVTTFYDKAVPILKGSGLNTIDAVELFAQWKPGDPYLFPNGGVHWSFHGAFRILERLPGKLNPILEPDLSMPILEREVMGSPRYTDRDILNLSNPLNHGLHKQSIPYPVLRKLDYDLPKPRILWIGTSFIWTLTHLANEGDLLDGSTVAYYYNTLTNVGRGGGVSKPLDRTTFNLDQFIDDYDAVVVVVHQNALEGVGDGFFEQAEVQLQPRSRTVTQWTDRVVRISSEQTIEDQCIELGDGFSSPESSGVWTDGTHAILQLPREVATAGELKMELEVFGFLAPEHPEQRVDIMLGSKLLHQDRLKYGDPGVKIITVTLPAEYLARRRDIRLLLPDAKSPKALGKSEDSRLLGIGVRSISLVRVSTTAL